MAQKDSYRSRVFLIYKSIIGTKDSSETGGNYMASIEKRGENSWRLVVEAGYDANGKRIKRSKSIKIKDQALLKTTKRLKDFLNNELVKFKIEVEAGEYIAPEKMTFEAFVLEWEAKYAQKHLAEKTLYTYRSNLKNRILPTFGHMRIDQIKPLHVLSFIDSLSKKGARLGFRKGDLSTGTIEINHRVLKNIFSRAVEWKLIKHNPVSSVKKPTVRHKEVVPYDESEVQQLLLALQKETIHWRVMVTLALTSGLRRGELLGLEWHHVGWGTSVLSVTQSVSMSPAGAAHVKEPKTKSSKRKVTLPSSMLEELKEYYVHKLEERDKIGDRWQGGEYNFMFCHPDGKAFHQERPYLWFRAFLKKNNLRYIKFHTLRHSHATYLISQGVHAKIISARLGHSNINTTMGIYGFALQSADQSAADKFESILTSNRQPE
jgi:integrase